MDSRTLWLETLASWNTLHGQNTGVYHPAVVVAVEQLGYVKALIQAVIFSQGDACYWLSLGTRLQGQ